MTAETNKEIVVHFFEEIFNHRNISYLEGRIAPDYTNHNSSIQVRGPEGLKRAIEAQFKAFPDLQTTLEDIIAEGDKVCGECICDHGNLQLHPMADKPCRCSESRVPGLVL